MHLFNVIHSNPFWMHHHDEQCMYSKIVIGYETLFSSCNDNNNNRPWKGRNIIRNSQFTLKNETDQQPTDRWSHWSNNRYSICQAFGIDSIFCSCSILDCILLIHCPGTEYQFHSSFFISFLFVSFLCHYFTNMFCSFWLYVVRATHKCTHTMYTCMYLVVTPHELYRKRIEVFFVLQIDLPINE